LQKKEKLWENWKREKEMKSAGKNEAKKLTASHRQYSKATLHINPVGLAG